MLQSKLTIEEILNRSFINTENSIRSWRKETGRWLSYGSKSVKTNLDTLMSIFTNDIQCFADLDPNDDVIARKLAFKKTESLFNAWRIDLDSQDWWCSTLRTRLDQIQISLSQDKNAFSKLSQKATTVT